LSALRRYPVRSAIRTRTGSEPRVVGVPTGIRTPVTAVKGRCPRPLDDGDCGYCFFPAGRAGGGNRDRTGDLLHAMQALSQLSYTPDRGRELYLSSRPAFYPKRGSAFRSVGFQLLREAQQHGLAPEQLEHGVDRGRLAPAGDE